jgi:hypothetical protein
VDGGADLELMMREGLVHEGWVAPAAAITAAGAYQWLWPLEPSLNAPAVGKLPVMLMNSASDERVPRAAILKLQASLPQAAVRWRPEPHVQPGQKTVIERLTHEVNAWLRQSDPPEPAAPAQKARAALADPH